MKVSVIFLILLLSLISFPGSLFALQGQVELSIEEDTKLWISQKIVARLTIKTDAYSIRNLRVDTQSGNDVIIREPTSAAYKTSERRGDTQWQHTVYEYVIYPMRAGDIILKPFVVEFSASMGYGQPEQTFNLETAQITLPVDKPEVVRNNSFVLTTKKLALDVSYTPDTDKLKVGDAFERKITVTAHDVPDFLLQPVPPYQEKIEDGKTSFKFYRSEPALSETEKNGTTIATRIEKDTFVASYESVATIPEILMHWWDPERQMLHTELIAAKTVTIIANPLVNRESSAKDTQGISDFILSKESAYWLLVVLPLLISVWWWLPKLRHKLAIRKKRFEAGEAGTFKRFEISCAQRNAHNIYKNFYVWTKLAMPHVLPLNFQCISHHYPELKDSLKSLESVLINDRGQFDAILFKDEVTSIRRAILIQQTHSDYKLIDSINPN